MNGRTPLQAFKRRLPTKPRAKPAAMQNRRLTPSSKLVSPCPCSSTFLYLYGMKRLLGRRNDSMETLEWVLDLARTGADFSSLTMQVVSASKEEDLELPIEHSPVNFAILMEDGTVSNTWGIKVEDTGDAYIYCRDNLRGQKISLHRSGKQHIAFDSSITKLPHFAGDRYLSKWDEPKFEDQAVASVCLLFPTWGVRLGVEQVRHFHAKWRKNELFIVGHREHMTVVSFYVVDERTTMRYRGSNPYISLCRLSLNPGKILHAFAWKEPEGDLPALIEERAFGHAASTFASQNAEEGSYCMSVGGERGKTHYLVTFPVSYTPPNTS